MINPYAVIYLAAYMVPAAIGFLALILYTHLLSPAQYGIYVVGMSIAGIVSALFFTWVRLSVSRYQARSPDLDLRGAAAAGYGGTVLVIACVTPLVILIIRPDVGLGFVAASLFPFAVICGLRDQSGIQARTLQSDALHDHCDDP